MTAKKLLSGIPYGERLPEPGWRMKPLILSHLAAIIVVGSWLWPLTRVWWDHLDVAVFKTLNGSLAYGGWWQTLWALGNIRLMDVVSGALLLVILISWLWGRPRGVQNMKIATLGALLVFLVAIPQISHEVIQDWFGYLRHSPTLVVDGALMLSKLVPALNAKDVSISSFPGDHAYTLFVFMVFFWYLGPRRYAVMVSILAIVLMMPRMVGGAHWMTDSVIGGGVPALLAVSWLLATPLGFHMARILLPLVRGVNALIPQWLRIPERMAS